MKGDSKLINTITKAIKSDIRKGWNFVASDSEEAQGDDEYERILTYHITLRKQRPFSDIARMEKHKQIW